jgi:hypothetical protein
MNRKSSESVPQGAAQHLICFSIEAGVIEADLGDISAGLSLPPLKYLGMNPNSCLPKQQAASVLHKYQAYRS